jgi:hypothetical protein
MGELPRRELGEAVDFLDRAMNAKRLVVLCGAGVSIATPTALPSARTIKELFRAELSWAWGHAGLPPCDFTFVSDLVLEQLISAFHLVMGLEALRFMDPFFHIRPNVNHRALARCGTAGHVADIITLNFDYGIETVAGAAMPLVLEAAQAKGVAYRGLCRLHKIHGTLKPEDRDASAERRYRRLQFTIERVGTALNSDLDEWLSGVLRDRILLVLGYSGEDLDVLPALRRQTRLQHVLWAFHPEDPIKDDSATHEWLASMKDAASILGAAAEAYLPVLAKHRGLHVSDPGDEDSRPSELSGTYLRMQQGSVLVAAGRLIHEAGPIGAREALLESLFDHLKHRGAAGVIPYRVQIAAAHLRAVYNQDAGNISIATKWYDKTAQLIEQYAPKEEIALELTLGQAKCRLAFQRASLLKRPRPWKWFPAPALAVVWLRRVANSGAPGVDLDGVEDIGAQKLASYFLGDVLAAWAIVADTILTPRVVARWLFRKAHSCFDSAVTPSGKWVPTQSFHQMRRDEAWLFANRERIVEALSKREYDGDIIPEWWTWKERVTHYDYISRIMGPHVHLRLVRLLKAMGAHLEGRAGLEPPERGRELLRGATKWYTEHGYQAGVIKAKTYQWVIDIEEGMDGVQARLNRFRELRALGGAVG